MELYHSRDQEQGAEEADLRPGLVQLSGRMLTPHAGTQHTLGEPEEERK